MSTSTCITSSTDSNIKVADRGSTSATFSNPGRTQFTITRFDGCVVKNSVACDYLVEKCGSGGLAVELKGADVAHATKQVEAGLRHLRAGGSSTGPVGGLIVCTRVPSNDTTVQRMRLEFAKKYRAPLTVRTNGAGLDFDALVKL